MPAELPPARSPGGEFPDNDPSPPGAPPALGPDAAVDRAYRVLLETARQLGSSLEPDAIFARLQKSVCGAMRCDGLIVSSFDRAENQIRFIPGRPPRFNGRFSRGLPSRLI